MSKFIVSWLEAAADILGTEYRRPVDALPGVVISASAATCTLMVDIAGDWQGTFTVTADETTLRDLFRQSLASDVPVESDPVVDLWQALFRRICLEAASRFAKVSGLACEVAMISPESARVGPTGMGYQLRLGDTAVALLIADEVFTAEVEMPRAPPLSPSGSTVRQKTPAGANRADTSGDDKAGEEFSSVSASPSAGQPSSMRGVELLLDIELEASLRFGSREMALSELLALGPGDVVQLDRALGDPVDLLVGNKIVARGEVILVNGNFGLQVTEVAEPRKTLESIRCLF